jgi:hypothetical protein
MGEEEGEEIQQQEEEGAGGGADNYHAYNNENADADEDDFNGHEHASQVPAYEFFPRLIKHGLTEPKHEMFVAGIFTQTNPVWVT